MHVYVCVCVHTGECVHVCVHACTCARPCVCVRARMRVCMEHAVSRSWGMCDNLLDFFTTDPSVLKIKSQKPLFWICPVGTPRFLKLLTSGGLGGQARNVQKMTGDGGVALTMPTD